MKSPWFIRARLFAVGIISLCFVTRLEAQNPCGAKLYADFVDQAQSLGPQAESLGRQLLSCPRDDYRQAAIYWLSFSYAMQGQMAAILGLGRALPSPGAGSEKIQVLYRAWQGDVSGLAQRVRLGQLEYAGDSASLLVLARNLMRVEQYREALNIYQQLINMPEVSEAAEIEKLYAIIWSQDFGAAALEVSALRRFELSEYMRRSLDRADLILKKFQGTDKIQSELLKPWLTAKGTDWLDFNGFRRRTAELAYDGPMHISAAAVELTHPLEQNRQRDGLFNFGRTWNKEGRWKLLTDLGYFTGGDGVFVGQFDNFIQLGEIWNIAFGLRREALAISERPLIAEAGDKAKNTAKLGFGFQKWLIFTAALSRVNDEALFADYLGELRFLDVIDSEKNQGFGIFIPFEYSQHPQPSADFLSYPKEVKLGVGARMAYVFEPKLHLIGETRLEVLNRSYYQNPKIFRRLLVADARIEARYRVQRSYFMFLAVERAYVEKNPDELIDEEKSEVSLGISLLGDGK
ncbi:MAG: hypothetical protein NTX25_20910 [Proteobacteria bacterium]|nr:hypothetical protein [Pseudomonadota bacterium]